MTVGNDLSFELPRGWTERLGSNGTKECLAGPDGSSGILQISELDSGDHRFLSAQAELGAVAQAMALGLSARECRSRSIFWPMVVEWGSTESS